MSSPEFVNVGTTGHVDHSPAQVGLVGSLIDSVPEDRGHKVIIVGGGSGSGQLLRGLLDRGGMRVTLFEPPDAGKPIDFSYDMAGSYIRARTGKGERKRCKRYRWR